MRRIGWLDAGAQMPPTGSDMGVDAQRTVGGASAPRRDGGTGGEPGFGGTLLPAADLRDPPQLPFQRQLPPHMPSPMRPAAPPHQHAAGGAIVQQLLPAGPMGQEVDSGKKPSSRPRHKKRAGESSSTATRRTRRSLSSARLRVVHRSREGHRTAAAGMEAEGRRTEAAAARLAVLGATSGPSSAHQARRRAAPAGDTDRPWFRSQEPHGSVPAVGGAVRSRARASEREERVQQQ